MRRARKPAHGFPVKHDFYGAALGISPSGLSSAHLAGRPGPLVRLKLPFDLSLGNSGSLPNSGFREASSGWGAPVSLNRAGKLELARPTCPFAPPVDRGIP
jgi:hypothetical protein